MRIGEILRQHREAERINIRDLAKDIGIDKSCLSRIENAKPCKPKVIMKLLVWLFS